MKISLESDCIEHNVLIQEVMKDAKNQADYMIVIYAERKK